MERARQSRYHSGMTKTPKRPRDPNQLAKFIIDAATADTDPGEDDKKNHAAVERGRLGGVKGGAARAAEEAKVVRVRGPYQKRSSI